MNMKPKILKNDREYQEALRQVDALWDIPKGSSRIAELELWSHLVDVYERGHQSIPLPDPIEAVRFRMEQMGLHNPDLAKIVGGRNRASEILNHKRPLSVSMMRNLYRDLHVPAESLLAEPSAKYR
jgi:HTH-type transcriptional regulator/antitoxin HigA